MCGGIIRRLFVYLPVIVIIVMLIMIHRTIMDFIIIIFIKPLSVAIHETMYEQMLQQLSRKGVQQAHFFAFATRTSYLPPIILYHVVCSVSQIFVHDTFTHMSGRHIDRLHVIEPQDK